MLSNATLPANEKTAFPVDQRQQTRFAIKAYDCVHSPQSDVPTTRDLSGFCRDWTRNLLVDAAHLLQSLANDVAQECRTFRINRPINRLVIDLNRIVFEL